MPEESLSDTTYSTDYNLGKDPEPLHGITEPDFHFSVCSRLFFVKLY